MANIVGLEGRSVDQLRYELSQGGKFVVYQYVFSVIIMSFKRGSAVHYIPPGGSRVVKGLPYVGLTWLLGWWGIPWGIIWTFTSTFTNLSGGKDVTQVVADILFSEAGAASGPVEVSAWDEPVAVPQRTVTVRFIAGPLTDQRFAVTPGGMYVGSSPGPQGLTVPDPQVAPAHCYLGFAPGGGLTVTDAGSGVPTYVVNSQSSVLVPPRQAVALQPGDMVYLGGQGAPVFVCEA